MNDEEARSGAGYLDKWWLNYCPPLAARPGTTGEDRLKATLDTHGKLPPELDTPKALWGRIALIHDCKDAFHAPAAEGRPEAALTEVTSLVQLGMLLEAARLAHLKWDALRYANDSGQAGAKQDLEMRLDFLALAHDLLPEVLSSDDQILADGIDAARRAMYVHLAGDRDLFGMAATDVPLGSPSLYLQDFKTALEALKAREKDYLAYQQALADADARGKRRRSALPQAKQDVEKHEEHYGLLLNAINTMVKTTLPAADTKAETARGALLKELETLRKWMRDRFDLSIEDFTECLFNLSFIQGPFSAFTTLSSQAIGTLNKAVNTIADDEGQPVKRKHLLKRVDIFGKELKSLNEAWQAMKTARPGDPAKIRVNDPDGYRLLVAQKNLEDLLARFYTDDEARAATAKMQEYVDAIEARNALVADYNNLVVDFLGAAGDRHKLAAQYTEVTKLDVPNAKPNLPAEAALVSAIYNRARERCIEYCYLACRASRFWTLQPDRALLDTVKLGSPAQVDYKVLDSVIGTLYTERSRDIESKSKEQIQPFPEDYGGGHSTGRCLVLREKTHPKFFEKLKKTGSASFSIPHPTSTTTLAENPFKSDTNVRLTRVRCWLLGVKTANSNCSVTVHVQHGGPEQMALKGGPIQLLTHDPVNFRFKYDWTTVMWDMVKQHVANPGAALIHDGMDGKIVLDQEIAGTLYPPLVGPFTQWTIKLDKDEHIELDLDHVSAVCVEFHGRSQSAN